MAQRINNRNLVGLTYGRLTVLESAGRATSGAATWLCQCTCGTLRVIYQNNLLRGYSQSCGCLQKERATATNKRHGRSKSYLHNTWCGIKQRCHNPHSPAYHNYGARGIQVCPEWRDTYDAFQDYILTHCGERPEGFSLDRIDNDGNYEPGNVRWADKVTQSRNSRSTVDHLHTPEVRRKAQQSLDNNGTRPRGESHGEAKLTEDAVKAIRRLREQGVTHTTLAATYSVSRYTIRAICSGKLWKHVELGPVGA